MRLAARTALLGGALLGALGWWLPWILDERGAAALVLLGLDLGDFWKFTAEWRAGLFTWERLTFFLPPVLAANLLTLWLAGATGRWRWLSAPPILFLALVVLPAIDLLLPYFAWFPPRLTDPDQSRQFSAQLYGSLATLLALLLVPLWQRLSTRVRALLALGLALAGMVLPAWAMWRTWPTLQGLYGGGAEIGPGLWLSMGGFLIAALGALVLARVEEASSPTAEPLSPAEAPLA